MRSLCVSVRRSRVQMRKFVLDVTPRRRGQSIVGASARAAGISEAPDSCRPAGQDRRPCGTAPPIIGLKTNRLGSIYPKILLAPAGVMAGPYIFRHRPALYDRVCHPKE